VYSLSSINLIGFFYGNWDRKSSKFV
jgi:hypothetical protein